MKRKYYHDINNNNNSNHKKNNGKKVKASEEMTSTVWDDTKKEKYNSLNQAASEAFDREEYEVSFQKYKKMKKIIQQGVEQKIPEYILDYAKLNSLMATCVERRIEKVRQNHSNVNSDQEIMLNFEKVKKYYRMAIKQLRESIRSILLNLDESHREIKIDLLIELRKCYQSYASFIVDFTPDEKEDILKEFEKAMKYAKKAKIFFSKEEKAFLKNRERLNQEEYYTELKHLYLILAELNFRMAYQYTDYLPYDFHKAISLLKIALKNYEVADHFNDQLLAINPASSPASTIKESMDEIYADIFIYHQRILENARLSMEKNKQAKNMLDYVKGINLAGIGERYQLDIYYCLFIAKKTLGLAFSSVHEMAEKYVEIYQKIKADEHALIEPLSQEHEEDYQRITDYLKNINSIDGTPSENNNDENKTDEDTEEDNVIHSQDQLKSSKKMEEDIEDALPQENISFSISNISIFNQTTPVAPMALISSQNPMGGQLDEAIENNCSDEKKIMDAIGEMFIGIIDVQNEDNLSLLYGSLFRSIGRFHAETKSQFSKDRKHVAANLDIASHLYDASTKMGNGLAIHFKSTLPKPVPIYQDVNYTAIGRIIDDSTDISSIKRDLNKLKSFTKKIIKQYHAEIESFYLEKPYLKAFAMALIKHLKLEYRSGAVELISKDQRGKNVATHQYDAIFDKTIEVVKKIPSHSISQLQQNASYLGQRKLH